MQTRQIELIRTRRYHMETQADVAKLINVDVRTYQNKESGVGQFKCREMFRIAEHYHCRVDDIFLP